MIYVIGIGCYSDWNIVGYMEDGDEAANYVVEMNKKAQYSWDKYWYIEAEKLTTEMEKKEWYVKRTYRVAEDSYGDKIESFYPNEMYSIDEDNYLTDEYEEPRYEVKKNTKYIIRELTITIKADVGREKALKICRDEFARLRAEREGL